MIRADLHFHTRFSPDASQQPRMIVEKLNSHRVINVLAITDHNTCEGYKIVHEYARTYTDILIIPGVEILANEGEIILLGATDLQSKPWSIPRIIDHAKQNNLLTVAPHRYRGLGLGSLLQSIEIDAIEVLNGITELHLNRKAEETARNRHLPMVAGSDAHFEADLWNVFTEIESEFNVSDVLEAIRNMKTRVHKIQELIPFKRMNKQ